MYASLLVQVIISQQPQLEPEDISLWQIYMLDWFTHENKSSYHLQDERFFRAHIILNIGTNDQWYLLSL